MTDQNRPKIIKWAGERGDELFDLRAERIHGSNHEHIAVFCYIKNQVAKPVIKGNTVWWSIQVIEPTPIPSGTQ